MFQIKSVQIDHGEPATLIEIDLGSEPLANESLEAFLEAAPEPIGGQGVVLSGKAPVWAYSALIHRYHATRWLATYDPRLNGAVIVTRHHKDAPPLGSVVAVG